MLNLIEGCGWAQSAKPTFKVWGGWIKATTEPGPEIHVLEEMFEKIHPGNMR